MSGNTQAAVQEGDLLWTPSREFVDQAQITLFIRWLGKTRSLSFEEYDDLWRWSVEDIDAFWAAVWAYFDILSDAPYDAVRSGPDMEHTRWFPGSRTNYAEHILRREAMVGPNEIAIFHSTETRPLRSLTWHELGERVRKTATRLRSLGIVPGDRIVSYMPNTPETVIAMLAAVSIGAVWSAASPEFGPQTVIERFGQLNPKLAFLADGYSFNGKLYDRGAEAAAIVHRLASIETVIWFDYISKASPDFSTADVLPYAALLQGTAPSRADFRYERVEHDHPLWILFSSGTTGVPKAIVHSHVGMIVEQYKAKAFHLNLTPASRNFFYTTTGWIMWNSLISGLIAGSSIVLYDGSPTFGGIDALWRMAADCEATIFGASPTLVRNMQKAGISPGKRYDLSKLQQIQLGGSPATPEVCAWFYEHVDPDIRVASSSGGTEVGSSFVAGVATRPTYAAEIQGRALGMDVHAFNEIAEDVTDDVGELVCKQPWPSMPLYFWGDESGQRYHESYFDVFPGLWRHGDLIKINARGGCYIYGRSDSTLNRYGVRIGSAEIYRIVEKIEGVRDSLVVCCALPGGDYYMPLFLALEEGAKLDECLLREIEGRLRQEGSPRHVPDELLAVPAIPYTLTGKRMEVPIRRILMGTPPEKAASKDAMANPHILDWFVDFAASSRMAARRTSA